MAMKLSPEAVTDLLHMIEHFDRERGIPHDYDTLEKLLRSVEAHATEDGQIFIISPKMGPV